MIICLIPFQDLNMVSCCFSLLHFTVLFWNNIIPWRGICGSNVIFRIMLIFVSVTPYFTSNPLNDTKILQFKCFSQTWRVCLNRRIKFYFVCHLSAHLNGQILFKYTPNIFIENIFFLWWKRIGTSGNMWSTHRLNKAKYLNPSKTLLNGVFVLTNCRTTLRHDWQICIALKGFKFESRSNRNRTKTNAWPQCHKQFLDYHSYTMLK